MRTNIIRSARLLVVVAVIAGLVAAPARADIDTDFAAQLHSYGIYGPRDYNAWLGKIACERMEVELDKSPADSARFLSTNLARGTTTAQSWQFLGAAVSAYCPELLPALSAVGPNR